MCIRDSPPTASTGGEHVHDPRPRCLGSQIAIPWRQIAVRERSSEGIGSRGSSLILASRGP
eukprot:1568367-Pyramimonas_sp.AAC.1